MLSRITFTIVGLSALCMLAIWLATGVWHITAAAGLWRTVAVLPLIGLPLAVVLIFVVGLLNVIARRKEQQ